jgi:hypothetical protein
MKRLVGFLASVMIAGGCAASETASAPAAPATPTNFAQQAPAPQPQAAPQPAVYRGEVWTWDEREGWVTLRQGSQDIRVKVSPDQFVGLQLHQIATLRGELAPPAEIVTIVPSGPMTFVPAGPEGEPVAITGRVTAVDPSGKLTIQTDRGPVEVWIAAGSPYAVGDTVQVNTTVRGVQVVSGAAPPAAQPAAAVATEPGDHAVVTGRIMGRDASGRLTVESPRGPIQVWVRPADLDRFKVGDFIQVRTRVRQAS